MGFLRKSRKQIQNIPCSYKGLKNFVDFGPKMQYLTILAQREKCPNTEFFLVRIQENTDQKKLRIWTLFKQCRHMLRLQFSKNVFRISS